MNFCIICTDTHTHTPGDVNVMMLNGNMFRILIFSYIFFRTRHTWTTCGFVIIFFLFLVPPIFFYFIIISIHIFFEFIEFIVAFIYWRGVICVCPTFLKTITKHHWIEFQQKTNKKKHETYTTVCRFLISCHSLHMMKIMVIHI